ncbi:OsmC family peroxiredoxin [Thalassococcus profundi]|uniref:OsmC family peroxiredoxin n=1 Tax=Thalassococcus profundi TaxID=2282382 RepID=A0A369TRY3_9RHOB|nr:OsmC family protein [Thalassococcus profundi]RDD68041.1 OsmC family peroxiredoxin [Thalassococcus profundi]
MSDSDLLPPSVDPNTKALGIRRVSARNEASTRSVMMVRDHIVVTDEKGTNTGPTPLELTLSSLMGCEGVIINRCAEAMNFSYTAVDMEGDGEVDQRGSRGVQGVRPYFNWVKLRIRVHTDEPEERFERLIRNVEYRCPVMNLFKAADVDVQMHWERVAP